MVPVTPYNPHNHQHSFFKCVSPFRNKKYMWKRFLRSGLIKYSKDEYTSAFINQNHVMFTITLVLYPNDHGWWKLWGIGLNSWQSFAFSSNESQENVCEYHPMHLIRKQFGGIIMVEAISLVRTLIEVFPLRISPNAFD